MVLPYHGDDAHASQVISGEVAGGQGSVIADGAHRHDAAPTHDLFTVIGVACRRLHLKAGVCTRVSDTQNFLRFRRVWPSMQVWTFQIVRLGEHPFVIISK